MTDTNKVKERAFKLKLKQEETSEKTENKQEAGYWKKNRITKREEETLCGKTDPKTGPVNSS